MKIRLVVALVGFAISFAVPTLAQEQNTVDPEVRQQIEAVLMSLARHTTSATRLLSQPYIRRTRFKCGTGKMLVRFTVSKPSRKIMQATSHRVPANSSTSLFR
jgi:hypothetical protein